MTLYTIPETHFDRALHSLPIAVCDLQSRQPVLVRTLDTTGGKMLVAEPVDPMLMLAKPNGVVMEDAKGGHGVRVASGQLESEGNSIFVGVLNLQNASTVIGHQRDTGIPADGLRELIRAVVREEIEKALMKNREDGNPNG